MLFALSTGWAVLASVGVTGVSVTIAFVKLRPERDALVAEAAEHVTTAMGTVLAELRTQLAESRREVERLKDREDELLRRIGVLEDSAQSELEQLRLQTRALLSRIAELEAGCHCRAD